MKYPSIIVWPGYIESNENDDQYVLVTGNAGYIGKSLIEHMSHQKKYICLGYDIENGLDILDEESLNSIFRKYNISIVIHLAAFSSVPICEENPQKAYKVNVEGTKNIINVMKKYGCNKIVYASTSSVYDDTECLLTEKSMINPQSVYAQTKYDAEKIIIKSNVNYVILRMFNVVGILDGIKSNLGYDRLFSSLMSGNITIYGNDYNTKDGTCIRDYVNIADVCRAYYLSLDYLSDKKKSIIINISSSVGTSVIDIVNLWKIKNPKLIVSYGQKRKGDKITTIGSNDLALSTIKWKPVHTINETINIM